jgi:hypothetical protein
VPHGVKVTGERYTTGFPVCNGSQKDLFAVSSGFEHLYVLCFKEIEKKKWWWWQRQLYTNREVYSSSNLLADLNFQLVSGLYKNVTRMSPSGFEFLINLIREKISKKDTAQESHFCSRKYGTDTTFR